MRKFFYPKSIAIIGVSPKEGNLAKNIVYNLKENNYEGKIFCIGLQQGELCGNKIYTSISKVEDEVDLAIILIPAMYVKNALLECGKKGIQCVIIESGGFSELEESKKFLKNITCASWDQTV